MAVPGTDLRNTSDEPQIPSETAQPFRCFNSSPKGLHLAVMMYGRFPLPLRNVEYLLFKRGIDLCHETVRMR